MVVVMGLTGPRQRGPDVTAGVLSTCLAGYGRHLLALCEGSTVVRVVPLYGASVARGSAPSWGAQDRTTPATTKPQPRPDLKANPGLWIAPLLDVDSSTVLTNRLRHGRPPSISPCSSTHPRTHPLLLAPRANLGASWMSLAEACLTTGSLLTAGPGRLGGLWKS